jgi:hypothetical protein
VPSGRQTFCLLLDGRVEEILEVLTELLFFWGRQLGATLEEHGRYGEVLGGPFGNRSPVNVADDAVAYLLCAFARRHCHNLHTECMVEPCLLFFESLVSLV